MTTVVLTLTFMTFANIQDRINACERSGKNSCIFDLLREIATHPIQEGSLIPKSGVYCSEDCTSDTIHATVTAGKGWVAVSNKNSTFYNFSGLYICEKRKCVLESDDNQYLFIHGQQLIKFHSGNSEFGAVWKNP